MNKETLTSKQKNLLDQLLNCKDPILQELADEIHYDHCYLSHTDQCGYAYGGWKLEDGHVNNVLGYGYAEERIKNYKKVEKLYKKFGIEKLKIYMEIRKCK